MLKRIVCLKIGINTNVNIVVPRKAKDVELENFKASFKELTADCNELSKNCCIQMQQASNCKKMSNKLNDDYVKEIKELNRELKEEQNNVTI